MGKKVKTFLHIFYHSLLPQTNYYHKLLKTKITLSFKYFITLSIIINLFLLILISIRFNYYKINRYLSGLIQMLGTVRPDFEIHITNGILITGNNRPDFFWLNIDSSRKLLMVIDETALPDKIHQYQSLSLLTGRELVFPKLSGNQLSHEIIPLTYFKNQTINIHTLKQISYRLIGLQAFLPFYYLILFLILLIFLPLISLLITSFYLAIIAGLIFITFKYFFSKKMSYKHVFQLSLHAVTLPLIIDYLIIGNRIFFPAQKLLFVSPSPFVFLILTTLFSFSAVFQVLFPQVVKPPTKHRRR